MVTFNSSEFISEAIESVLASSFQNFELIICDDCSSDNTMDIVVGYTDLRIRVYKNDHNLGEYPNRNKCIDLASGKYLIFIDGDDTIHVEGLQMAVKAMESFSDDLAYGIARPENENYRRPLVVRPSESYKMHYFGKSIFNLSFSRNIFNTKILKAVGGLPLNYISGDTAIRLQLASTYDVVIIEDHLGKWRKRDGQASDKLNTSLKGMLEPYQINLHYLIMENCPLDVYEKKDALWIMIKKQFVQSTVMLKRGEILFSFALLKLIIKTAYVGFKSIRSYTTA